MIKTSTKNEVIKLIYGDIQDLEKENLMKQQLTDEELATEIQDLKCVQSVLDNFTMEAPASLTQHIMNFVRKSTIESA